MKCVKNRQYDSMPTKGMVFLTRENLFFNLLSIRLDNGREIDFDFKYGLKTAPAEDLWNLSEKTVGMIYEIVDIKKENK